MKNLLIVSHCILNNAAKVEQDEAELAEEYKIREELMQLILNFLPFSEVSFEIRCTAASIALSGIYYVWISEMGTCEEPVSTSILHGTMP